MQRVILIGATAVVLAAGELHAQSNVDPSRKFAWGENIGWANWRDAGAGAQGVHVGETFMAGYVWAENVGYVNVGDGSPTNGVSYANSAGSDSGVNVDPVTGELFGLAWGENIGWVNFDTRSKGAQRARVDVLARRLRGYVWGENVGWINLDDAGEYAGFAPDYTCTCGDFDASGGAVDLNDFNVFANCFGLVTPKAGCAAKELFCTDLDGDGTVGLTDFGTFAVLFGLTGTKSPPNCL